MIKCRKCGEELAENAKYCIFCGSPVNVENKCKLCGTVNLPVARFCIECGNVLDDDGLEKGKVNKQTVLSTLDKVAKIIAWCLSGVLALISIIFFFTAGISVDLSASMNDINQSTVTEANIFSIAFDSVSEIYKMLQNGTTDLEKSIYGYRLLGQSIISFAIVGTMIALVTMAIIAIVKWVKFGKDRSVNVSGIAIKMFFTFMSCVCLMGGLYYNNGHMTHTSTYMSLTYNYDGGLSDLTMAGIIIGVVILCLLLACKVYLNRAHFTKNGVAITAVSSVALILVISMLFVLSNGGLVVNETSDPSSNYSSESFLRFGFNYHLQGLSSPYEQNEQLASLMLMLVVGVASSFEFALFCLFLSCTLCTVIEGKKSCVLSLLFSTITFLSSIGYLIISLNIIDRYNDYLSESTSTTIYTPACGISLLFLTLVIVGACIAVVVIKAKTKTMNASNEFLFKERYGE